MPEQKGRIGTRTKRNIGPRIKERREEAGLSLSALAQKADVSKGYLWSLEKGKTEARPSGDTLYRIAAALGTTMSDLLGRAVLAEQEPPEVPPSLRRFASKEDLRDQDVQMLARINFRGQQPDDADSWALVWQAVKASVRKGNR
jgi:transcriptional regulator with XRE-family HTH domain